MNRQKEEAMNMEFGLLTDEQVFGEQKNDVIAALGAKCAVTDYAILSGAELREDVHIEQDSSFKGRTGRYYLASAGGYGDVCCVSEEGTRVLAYANGNGSLRPVLPCSDPAGISNQIHKDISGFQEVLFGEYPQYTADRTKARELESERSAGALRRTGKTYAAQYEEYIYEEKKYIRANYLPGTTRQLSNGKAYKTDDPVWVEVSPVSWLWDRKAGILISRNILAAGVRYCPDNYYDGDFAATDVCRYLNTDFAQDLTPSVIREMTAEEKAAYEEEKAIAEKRRNPYGLTFGSVTEEDIIRGAIESDVPVFLHGPSSEGKSARVKQIDPTCELIYLRNATPDSLNGRSVYNQSTGEMIDIPPTWYKKLKEKCEAEPDTFHVVFFDEINNALPSIQGMAFNIVLDREVNGLWKLPPNARVVAAGNDMQDSLAANQIAAPFFNRFAHVYINTTTDKWLRWARTHDIHPAIYAYIAFKRGETLRSRYDGIRPNADPRKWEMASKMLYATGHPEMLRALIGEDITDEFVQFCNQPVITLDSVLNGDVSDSEIEALNTSERYATTMGLSQAEEKDMDVVREFVSRMGAEFVAVLDSIRSR